MGRSLPILGVPGVLGKRKKTLIITNFTQSLGAELLTNGDFSAWTGDNPDGWTVTGESGGDPEVTERAPAAGHGDAVGAGGAANFYASAASNNPGVYQNVATVGKWYEYTRDLTYYTAGNSVVERYGGVETIINAPGVMRSTFRAIGAYVGIRSHSGGTAPNFTIDSVSYKRITLNAQQIMPSADAIVDFTYTLPVSPAAGDTINVFYRISGADLETDYTCWRAYLQRNAWNTAWDFRLDSVSAGTATNRIAVTNVGNAVGIRVQCAGTLHDCWTTANGVDWTKRGAQVNVSLNDTSKGINTIYASTATPIQLAIRP